MSTVNGVYFCHACHAKGSLRTFLNNIGLPRSVVDQKYAVLLEEAKNATPTPPNPLKPGVFDLPPISDSFLGLLDFLPESLLSDGYYASTLRVFEVGWDRWHQRITYPIRDIRGELVAVSGRAIQPGIRPRYKIYDREYSTWGLPQRWGWDKRYVLYNAHVVYPSLSLQRKDAIHLIVVEGFKAAMWVHQAGLTDVVALLGTYLSWEQRWILERISGTVYLFLDNNLAGLQGTIEAGMQLTSCSIDVRVIEYPQRLINEERAQPDDLTPDEIWEQYADAPSFYAWLRRLRDDDPTE